MGDVSKGGLVATELDLAIGAMEDGVDEFRVFLAAVEAPDALKVKWAHLIAGDMRRNGAPERYALFGFDLWSIKDELKKMGFRFHSWKHGTGRNYWCHDCVDDNIREYVRGLPGVHEAMLVLEDGPKGTLNQVKAWKDELLALSRGTPYTVKDSGVACRVTKGAKNGINQIIDSYALYQKWRYTLVHCRRRITGEE